MVDNCMCGMVDECVCNMVDDCVCGMVDSLCFLCVGKLLVNKLSSAMMLLRSCPVISAL